MYLSETYHCSNWQMFHVIWRLSSTTIHMEIINIGIMLRSADVLSVRRFVRTALDILSGWCFVRTALDVLSGPTCLRRFVRKTFCQDRLRRFVRTRTLGHYLNVTFVKRPRSKVLSQPGGKTKHTMRHSFLVFGLFLLQSLLSISTSNRQKLLVISVCPFLTQLS